MGRGPVCGMIIRGPAGAAGRGGCGATGGLGATVCADGGAADVCAVGAVGVTAVTGGADAGGMLTIGGAGLVAGGTINLGGAAGVEGAVGGAGVLTTGAAATGLASCGGALGRAGATGGAAAPGALPMMAFSTSPGLEMCDKSILVLMPSGSGRALRADLEAPSPVPRRRMRTFSASCSSRELECVFFSVTPTSVNTSRIALLLTSSSRARSLIRTLLIRLFVPPKFSR